jgi:hypothetical protein
MARIEFAPDGEHWHTIVKGNLMRLWNYFISNAEIRQQITINPYAKFRLIGDDIVIGVLPSREENLNADYEITNE